MSDINKTDSSSDKKETGCLPALILLGGTGTVFIIVLLLLKKILL